MPSASSTACRRCGPSPLAPGCTTSGATGRDTTRPWAAARCQPPPHFGRRRCLRRALAAVCPHRPALAAAPRPSPLPGLAPGWPVLAGLRLDYGVGLEEAVSVGRLGA